MKNKILMGIPILALLFVSLVSAIDGSFSLRSAVGEPLNVNVNSNGVTGNGYIIDTSGVTRTSYSFKQTNGMWSAMTQIGRVRGTWQPVTLNYDSVLGTLTIVELGISANVINLR